MDSKFLQRLTLAAVLIGGLGLLDAQTAAATRPVRRTARPAAARGFNLFAGAVNVMMNVNRIQCNINNIGETCVDPTNSPVVGGGYWPKGTPDQYIFNGGLQIAGLLGGNRATFPWAGDTVGAFIFDPRGDQSHGEGLTNVFNGLSAADLAEWPTAAYVNDPTLFNAALLGRKTVSQQDTWVRYWDGNVNLTTGRQHPMGLLIDQRGLMWNFPSGNQDIVYFLYRFINITADSAYKYDNLADFGYSGLDIARIVEIARDFRARSEARYDVSLPKAGWDFTQVYAAFAQDPDVGASGQNYSTAILPFAMGVAYKSNFYEPTWAYPADIFGAPFAAAPGFEGVKYLKSPTNPATTLPYGITMFTNTTNGAPFPDRVGVQALWRLFSNNLIAQDGVCNAPTGTPMCQLVSTPVDTRFVQASGPLTIAAGQSAGIVVAYVHAAPVAAYVTGASASFDLKPGIPGTMNRLATGVDTIRTIERAAGIAASVPRTVSGLDANANGFIEQGELATMPRSLLHKGLVAQAVFDAKFLLPFAPESPTFYAIPGDGQVALAWQQSATETTGDPYWVVALDVLNSLYDPNFRRYDVEGYRVWRGRTEAEMEVIATFDYADRTITDRTGQFFYPNKPQCAPELGNNWMVGADTVCPVNFNTAGTGGTNDVSLAGEVIQIPPGGRVRLASGGIMVVAADTAITGGNSGLPPLTDNGVPFVYVDNDVRNGFRYFYAVTAFDVNSFKSGPSSLESPLVTRQATPRATSSNPQTEASLVVTMIAPNGDTLNPNASFSIDGATGTFSGPVPPANDAFLGFLAYFPKALPAGNITVTVDSLAGGWWPADLGAGASPTVYYTLRHADTTISFNSGGNTPSYAMHAAEYVTTEYSSALVKYDSALAVRLGIANSSALRMPMRFAGALIGITSTSPAVALASGRFGTGYASTASRYLSHSRWLDEGGTEAPDPTINSLADSAHHAGKLTGVGRIYSPSVYRQPDESNASDLTQQVGTRFRSFAYAFQFWYPADLRVHWNADSTITVTDMTHRATIPFGTGLGLSWGFLDTLGYVGRTTANFRSADACSGATCPAGIAPTAGVVNYRHLYQVPPVSSYRGQPAVNLVNKAKILPLDLTNEGTQDATGIVLFIFGEPFFMEMAAIPPANREWRLRAIGGQGMSATCTGSAPTYTDCGSYSFSPLAPRPSYVRGLRYKLEFSPATFDTAVSGDLSRIHTVPDPYYVTNALEITASTKVLRFVNLPDRAIIRIYSVSGILVNVLTHNNSAGGGEEVWNLRNRNNQFIASGVYFYHVETPDGQTKIGRFTVVNYAQ